MRAYADYTFYKEEFLGSRLTEKQFPALASQASAYLDRLTFSRAGRAGESLREALASACCAVAEELDRMESGRISSETVGEWTRAYREDGRDRAGRLYDAASPYLGETGLLYRGCG